MELIKKLTLLALLLIAILAMPIQGFAQQSRTISGVVLGENDDPVIGATVTVPGTSVGTATDVDGKFQLTVPAGHLNVQVSYLGYQSKTASFSSQNNLTVKLVPEDKVLDELVVIGYGAVKKRDLTGAISTVKSSDIVLAPVTNPLEAIEGRVAGLDISRINGKVSSDSKILLRGNRSLTADNSPLYIIDGIPGSINDLNPNDIASIEVLKDASSTAIYGSAGANGVLIVTTKQAEKGKMQVDFTSYLGVNTNPSYPKALRGDAWIKYLRDGYTATYPSAADPTLEALFTEYSFPTEALSYANNNQWIDWVNESLRTGVQQDYTLSMRGGGETIKGNLSLGVNNNQGVLLNDDEKRYTLRTGLDAQLKPWLKAGIQLGLIYSDANTRNSRINRAFTTIPLGEVRDENGDINDYPISGASVVSPIVDNIDGTYSHNVKRVNVRANPYIEISPVKGLTYKSLIGTTLNYRRTGEFNSNHTYAALAQGAGTLNNASYNTSMSYKYVWENIVNYNTLIAGNHSLGFTLATSWTDEQNESSGATGINFMYDDFLWYRLQAGLDRPSVNSTYNMQRMMSYIGRINYAFKGKYLLSVSARRDGASQLVKKWDTFPAASVAWRISDESFMEAAKGWLSNLKLRGGYGVVGNSNISPYSSKTEIEPSSGNDASLSLGNGKVPTNVLTRAVGNGALTWEKSYSTNIGLDLGLFNNRVDASLEWYDTDTKNMLYARGLPSSGGVYSPNTLYTMTSNIARMHNKGFEITLNTRNIVNKNFQWTSTLTFAKNTEKLTDIDLGSSIKVDDLKSMGLFIDYPKNTVYGLKKLGIWQEGEASDAAVFGLLPGDVKVQSNLTKESDGVWVDNTGDNPVEYTAQNPYTISAKDRVILGQIDPKWSGGFQNTFSSHNFDLSVFIIARWGQVVNNSLLGWFGREAMPETYNYWTPDNPTNDFPRYYSKRTTQYSNPIPSDGALTVVDGSYWKIKNITLGYELPKSICDKIGLSKVRLYGTMYNAFIFTKSHLLKDIDPEGGSVNTTDDPRAAVNTTGDSFPLYRQMVFGINVSF